MILEIKNTLVHPYDTFSLIISIRLDQQFLFKMGYIRIAANKISVIRVVYIRLLRKHRPAL